MRVLHYFDPNRKKGKFFMILILSFAEKMLLAKLGGFDKAIGTEGWIEGDALAGSLKFPDKEAYVFRYRRESLDFIYTKLAEKLGWEAKIKNILNTPSFEELLAKQHNKKESGILKLYIDHDLPLLSQRRRLLWATFWPATEDDYRKFWDECRSINSYAKLAAWTYNVIVTRGHFQSGYAWLQIYLKEYKGVSITTDVLDAVSYPELLLRSVL